MELVKSYFIDTNVSSQNMGNVIPAWLGNYDRDKWFYNPNDGIYYFYSQNADAMFIQYGYDNRDYASARFFGETVQIISQTENSDKSITATVKVTPDFFSSRKTQYATRGFAVNYKVSINGVIIYQYSGTTTDEFTNGTGQTQTFSVVVKPSETVSTTAFQIELNYPNGEAPNSTTVVGVGLYNPNPPSYKPMAYYNNGWKELNNPNGYIGTFVNGVWKDISDESINTIGEVNKGTNQIYTNRGWVQQPPMKGGNVDG